MITGKVCDWTEEDDGWETDCGNMYVIIEGTPEERGMRTCIFCNRPLVQHLATEETVYGANSKVEGTTRHG